MSDPSSPNHWDSLASDLGVSPTEDQSSPSSPPPLPSQVPTPKPSPPAQRGKPQPRALTEAANWDLIAGELGVVLAAGCCGTSRPAGSGLAKGDHYWHGAVRSRPSRPARRNRRIFSTSHSISTSHLMCWNRPMAPSTEQPEPPQPELHAEKHSRKRRRRRRPSGDTMAKEAGRTAKAGREPVASVPSEPETDEHRPRRRRPRRGKKKRPSDEAAAAAVIWPAVENRRF